MSDEEGIQKHGAPPIDVEVKAVADTVVRMGTSIQLAHQQDLVDQRVEFGNIVMQGSPPGWIFHLPDGRWLVVDLGRRGPRHPLLNLALYLGSIALGVGLVAYPFVRRLTRRLERLQKRCRTHWGR